MIIESGIIVALGLAFMFFKMSWRARIWTLSRPLFMDVTIFLLLNLIHMGTFSGVMVAAVGALVCSGMLTCGRTVFGYMEKRMYYPGWYDVSPHLLK